MRKLLFAIAILLAGLILLSIGACAEKAAECQPKRIISTVNQENLPGLTDHSYKTIWYAKRGYLQIELSPSQPAYGIYLCYHKKVVPVVIQIPDGKGNYKDYVRIKGKYLHQYTDLPGVSTIRIRIANERKKEMLELAEIRILGKGELPGWVQCWRTAKKADLMLLSAHPDDELLWFGGTLPTYAGERGLRVQVVYLAHGDSWRMNELLDGLWVCGVKDYPIIGEYRDFKPKDRSELYSAWGGTKTVYPWFVSIIRRLQPEVLITQDFDGEYGHPAHQIAAYMAVNCPPKAADSKYDAASKAKYGIWQVKKVYIHLYKKNRVVMDWKKPLRAFKGKTSLQIANSALKCHKSQQPIGYSAKQSGPYDCRLFGLYASTVGPDILMNDFFENIVISK